jgi:4,5-dihydroxyphthalate decarboxylase
VLGAASKTTNLGTGLLQSQMRKTQAAIPTRVWKALRGQVSVGRRVTLRFRNANGRSTQFEVHLNCHPAKHVEIELTRPGHRSRCPYNEWKRPMSMQTPLKLSLVIGDEPITASVKRGEIKSELIDFDVVQVTPVHTAFKPMARELRYDVCEMAIVTYLMAVDRGIPITLIPAVMLGRPQQPLFIQNTASGRFEPKDLPGKRVAVRAYSQTTGAYIRGMLGEEHGVSFKDIEWVTFEGAHVPDFDEPTWVTRAPEGSSLLDMLKAGEVDAAITEKTNDPNLVPVIPDADAVAERWAEARGFAPVNHLVVIRTELVKQHPWLAAEVYRILKASKEAAHAPVGRDPMPFGVEANRNAFDLIARYAFEQDIVSKLYTTDELFEGALGELN